MADPTADRTFTLPNAASGTFVFSSLATNGIDVANSVWGASNAWVFEGATADAFETSVAPTDVGADITLTMPGLGNVAGAFLASTLTTNDADIANSVWGVSNGVRFEGATADAFEMTLASADVLADGTLTLTSDGQAAGEQLQTNGSGSLTWEAAGSKRAFKFVEGLVSPSEGLAAILAAPVHRFHYRQIGVHGEPTTTTGDFRTEYVGVLAEEAPWAMHHRGRILNPVNTAGYAFLGIQALANELASVRAELASMRMELAGKR